MLAGGELAEAAAVVSLSVRWNGAKSSLAWTYSLERSAISKASAGAAASSIRRGSSRRGASCTRVAAFGSAPWPKRSARRRRRRDLAAIELNQFEDAEQDCAPPEGKAGSPDYPLNLTALSNNWQQGDRGHEQ